LGSTLAAPVLGFEALFDRAWDALEDADLADDFAELFFTERLEVDLLVRAIFVLVILLNKKALAVNVIASLNGRIIAVAIGISAKYCIQNAHY